MKIALRKVSLPVLTTFGALVVALSYSQIGWRATEDKYQLARKRASDWELRSTFPRDGSHVSESSLRILDGWDTLSLTGLVRGGPAVVYFAREGCPPCDWLRGQLDTLMPNWRDSIVLVSTFDEGRGPKTGLALDSISSLTVEGVPAILVIDSAGFVRHSVASGLVPVARVLAFMRYPSPIDQLVNDIGSVEGTFPTSPGAGDANAK